MGHMIQHLKILYHIELNLKQKKQHSMVEVLFISFKSFVMLHHVSCMLIPDKQSYRVAVLFAQRYGVCFKRSSGEKS